MPTNDWPEVKLGAISRTQRGLAYTSATLIPPGRPFVTLKCFERGGGFRTDGLKTYRGAAPAEFLLREGDLLLANTDVTRDAAIVGAAALTPHFDGDRAVFSMDATRLLTDESKVTNRFLAARLALADARRYMQARAPGTTVLHLQVSEVPRLSIRLPPTVEQRRIAEVLDTLDETIRKTEQLIAKLKQMKQGFLHDLLIRGLDDNGELRDPERHPEQFKKSVVGNIPTTWDVVPLGHAADIIDPNPSHRYPSEVAGGVPIASTENFMGDDDFDLSFSKRVPWVVFDEQNKRCRFQPDDVVFARKGGLGFARPFGPERKVFSHTVVLMKARQGRAHNKFLLWAVRSNSFFDGIRTRMNTNVGVPTLGVGFLSQVSVAIPLPSEQEAIAKVLDSVQLRLAAEQETLAKKRLLKRGISDDLLMGRVRVGDPDEGPA